MKLFCKDKPIEVWELRGPGFLYLASPYSRFSGGLDAAYEGACRIAGWLVENQISVFCPIAMFHSIAMNSMLDPLDHKIWLPADEPFMQAARGLIVAEMDGWDTSYGVKIEIDHFSMAGKPIVHLRGVN